MASTMELCLNLVPLPMLAPCFKTLKFLWDSVQEIKNLKMQLLTLVEIVGELLLSLDRQGRINGGNTSIKANTSKELESLRILLKDINTFIDETNNYNLLKLLYMHSDSLLAIELFHRRIANLAHTFNITAHLNIQDWQASNVAARSKDQDALDSRLKALESNQKDLANVLNSQHSSVMAMMAALQKTLDKHTSTAHQQRFLTHSLNYLASTSGEQVKLEPWTITSFEIEFGQEIGSGGFGIVRKGTWNRTPVALKLFKAETGGVPSGAVIRKEVETWANLRHPNIIQFLGANVLDKEPFIVMPLYEHGNARDFIQNHPSCNRVKILHDVSLGLLFLHLHNVIHGDMKALNILINKAKDAVLCDFGLSRVKADASSTAVNSALSASVAGSRNWMSPERLKGGALKKPVDIYALGMTIFELFSGEIPFAHIDGDFFTIVAKHEVRPERPDDEDAPTLTDDIWRLAERCWVPDPRLRPDAASVSKDIEACLASSPEEAPPPPPHPPRHANTAPEQYFTSQQSKPLPSIHARSNPPVPPPPGAAPSHSGPRDPWETGATLIEQGSLASSPIAMRATQGLHNRHRSLPSSQFPLTTSPSSEGYPAQTDTANWSGATAVENVVPLSRFKAAAKVVKTYKASNHDPHELDINKGEILDILNDDGKWWIARKEDGKEGIVPSNHVELIAKKPSQPWSRTSRFSTLTRTSLDNTRSLISSPSEAKAKAKAKARYPYTASQRDTNEISFVKGEVLDVYEKDDNWWIARKADGTEGIVPSNYMQVL